MNRRDFIRSYVFAVPGCATAKPARSRQTHRFLQIVAHCILATAGSTSAQVFPPDLVGFINLPLPVGQSLIGNPLDADVNTLNGIFDPLVVPPGATLAKWDAASGQYLPASIFGAGGWSINYALPPGEGALLTAPTAFMNVFVGRVLTLDSPSEVAPVAVGTYLLASRAPVQLGPGHPAVFESILKRGPRNGEQFRWLDSITQQYRTTTYTGGTWNNGVPALNVGQAAFFMLVPEPSTLIASILVIVPAIGPRIRRRELRRSWRPWRLQIAWLSAAHDD